MAVKRKPEIMRTAAEVRAMTAAERELVMERALDALMEGQTLQDACEAMGFPPSTVRKWLVTDEAWRGRYHAARLAQGQAMAEEAIRVARDSTNHSSAADRLLIETLKWAASKANPAEYGDRQTVEHQGAQTLQIKVLETDGLQGRHDGGSETLSQGVSVIALPSGIIPGKNP